jgi:1-acyl-sn-glycerol-3-phosphate acyltransferase
MMTVILYNRSSTFKYFFKMSIYFWVGQALAIAYIPIYAMKYAITHENSTIFVQHGLMWPSVWCLTRMLGIKWTQKGAENLTANESAVIVVNHQSVCDIIGLYCEWHRLWT